MGLRHVAEVQNLVLFEWNSGSKVKNAIPLSVWQESALEYYRTCYVLSSARCGSMLHSWWSVPAATPNDRLADTAVKHPSGSSPGQQPEEREIENMLGILITEQNKRYSTFRYKMFSVFTKQNNEHLIGWKLQENFATEYGNGDMVYQETGFKC
jgi:hypothetical protein